MANPKCEKCSWHPKMSFLSRGRVFELRPGQTSIVSHSMRRSGHPAIALALSIFGGVAGAANYFFEEIRYKCSTCGTETSQYKRKKK